VCRLWANLFQNGFIQGGIAGINTSSADARGKLKRYLIAHVCEDVNMVDANGIVEMLGMRPTWTRQLNLFNATNGEVLPTSVFRNHKNLLILELE
jgi:hypothetical protein